MNDYKSIWRTYNFEENFDFAIDYEINKVEEIDTIWEQGCKVLVNRDFRFGVENKQSIVEHFF